MKTVRLFLVPGALLLVMLTWFGAEALRAKWAQAERYRLPADTTPREMLSFMRRMDGSSETSQGLAQSDNSREICNAILAASERLPDDAAELTPQEHREVQFYRLKYSAGAIMRGYISDSQTTVDELLDDARNFLVQDEEFGAHEQLIAGTTLMVLEGTGRFDAELEFVEWMTRQLGKRNDRPEEALYLARLKKIASRLKLLDHELDLQSTTLAGEVFEMQSLHGKVVLVEFWSTRCKPCIADFPALKRIYNQYQAKGFEIVGVCMGAEPERIRRFVTEQRLPWVQLCHDATASSSCNEPLSEEFGIEAVPTTFLVNQQGEVIAQGVRPLHNDPANDLEQRLAELLPRAAGGPASAGRAPE